MTMLKSNDVINRGMSLAAVKRVDQQQSSTVILQFNIFAGKLQSFCVPDIPLFIEKTILFQFY